MQITAQDKTKEDALTMAIQSRHEETAIYLVEQKAFDLSATSQRTGFNYFAYALLKGCLRVCRAMLVQLKSKPNWKAVVNAKIKK